MSDGFLSFVFPETIKKQIDAMPGDMKLRFYEAVTDYGMYGEEPSGLSELEAVIWISMRDLIDRCRRSVPGAPRGNRNARKQTETTENNQNNIVFDENNQNNIVFGKTTKTTLSNHNHNHNHNGNCNGNDNTHTQEKTEKQTETQNYARVCVNPCVCGEDTPEIPAGNGHAGIAPPDDTPALTGTAPPVGTDPPVDTTPPVPAVSGPQEEYARIIYGIWEGADLPRPKSGFPGFLMSDFRLALEELSPQGVHSDDVIQAARNYALVVGMSRKGESWWNSKSSFDGFVRPNILRKFLPDNFDVERFRQGSPPKRERSAMQRQDHPDDMGEILF